MKEIINSKLLAIIFLNIILSLFGEYYSYDQAILLILVLIFVYQK